jgi:pimeloyl-ACP methyl ester carboxylesterase
MRACQPSRDGYVERDGVKVFYEVFGTGEPTVLLLPTWSIVHSRLWKMQIPYLARHCRVLTFDPRGNGRSDRPTQPGAYAEREFAADALAVMDATQTPRAVIVGFSMGGQRGLLLAANHPERVEAAVFIGAIYPGGGAPLPEQTVYSWEDELDTDEGWAKHNQHYWLRDYQGYLEFFMSRVFTEPHSTKPTEDTVGWGLETTGETLVLTYQGLEPDEARELARRVRCPVLVIHGDHDAVGSVTRGIALAEHTAGRLVLLEGSGHAPHVRDRLTAPASSNAGSSGASCRCPAVTRITSGRPPPSTRRCSLLLSPPRLRPRPHPAAVRFPLAVRHARLAPCAGGVLVGADHAAVHVMHQPVQLTEGVGAAGDLGQQPVEHTQATPAVEAAGDRAPGTKGVGQVPPRRAGAQQPHDRFQDLAVVLVGPAGGRALRGQQRFEHCPSRVGKLTLFSGHTTELSGQTAPQAFANTP